MVVQHRLNLHINLVDLLLEMIYLKVLVHLALDNLLVKFTILEYLIKKNLVLNF